MSNIPVHILFEEIASGLSKAGLSKYSAPVFADAAAAPGVTIQPFGPYDSGGGNWKFSTGLAFRMPAASAAKQLLTVCTGSIRYKAGAGGKPGSVILTRGDAVASAVGQEQGGYPLWFPAPQYIIYENVDPNEARRAVLTLLQQKDVVASARERLKKAGNANPPAAAAQLADLWMQDNLPGGVAVRAGDTVGACGASATAGTLEATVRLVDRLDPSPTLFYNLSYWLAQWSASGWIASGNELLAAQNEASGPVCSTGKMFFVQKAGGGTAPFDTPANASQTIGASLQAAASGDTVVILDAGAYAEQLTVNKAVSILGVSRKKAMDASPGYPVISGGGAARPVLLEGVTTGLAFLGKVSVENGLAKHGDLKGMGGGILVRNGCNAVISNCIVRNCWAKGGGIFAEGYGGGIGSYHASPLITGCLVERNHAAGRGSGIGAWGYGWPSFFESTVRQNIPPSPADVSGNPILNPTEGLSGLYKNIRGDGGGIAITIAVNQDEDLDALRITTRANLATHWDAAKLKRNWRNWVYVVGCTVEDNQAYDDGGGIFISIASRVKMIKCTIRNNHAVNNGGGIRVTMRSELVVRGGLISRNESNSGLDPNTRSGGGGIASRNSTLVDLGDGLLIENNKANGFAGGGISFISTDEGDLLGTWPPLVTPPDFDWNDVLLDPALFGFTQARLVMASNVSVHNNSAAVIGSRTPDPGKGGGLYTLRFKGPRHATRISATIEGQPIEIRVAATALQATNTSTFAGAKRLYLDDRVVSPAVVKSDAELPASGEFTYG